MSAATDSDRSVDGARVTQASTRAVSVLTQEIVDSLVQQRQELRRDGAGKPTLEANRLAIVYWQQRLANALAAEHR